MIWSMRTLPLTEAHRSEPNCVRLVPIFSGLTVEQQGLVKQRARPVRMARGEVLHVAGDQPGAMGVVHQGEIALSRTMPSGRTRLLRVARTGDTVGELAYVAGSTTHDEAVALSDAQLCVFAHADLDELMGRYPDIAVRMMHSLGDRLAQAERNLGLSGLGVDVRLADFLLQQPIRRDASTDTAGAGETAAGSRAAGVGRLQVLLPLSKKDIASLLGTTPESFSRALARLTADGLIAVDGEVVSLVDPQGLEDRVGDA